MNGMTRWGGIASIVNQYQHPVVSILALYLEGEIPEQLGRRLQDALATLPFRTIFSYVIFDHSDHVEAMLRRGRVTAIVDRPGSKMVSLGLETVIDGNFFLPRDPDSGQFLHIEDQIQCVAALATGPVEEMERVNAWLEEARKRLGLPEDWRIQPEEFVLADEAAPQKVSVYPR